MTVGVFTLVYSGFIVAMPATEADLLKIKLDPNKNNKMWPNYYISTDEFGPVLYCCSFCEHFRTCFNGKLRRCKHNFKYKNVQQTGQINLFCIYRGSLGGATKRVNLKVHLHWRDFALACTFSKENK